MRVDTHVTSTLDHTFVGHQLVVGIKDANSFVKYDKSYAAEVEAFIERFQREDIEVETLTDAQRRVLDSFTKLGYLDVSQSQTKSFNEFRSVGRTLWSLHPKRQGGGRGNSLMGVSIVLMTAAMLGLVVWLLRAQLPGSIDYRAMTWPEIALTAGLFPVLILTLHELGHLAMAYWMGVAVESLSVGWFFVHPIVLLQYRGINLERQRQRAVVMLGGVYVNLVLLTGGLVLKAADLAHGAPVDIWIAANLGLIITNAGVFGMTDGYFLFTMFLGLTNLRMRGYKYVHGLLNGHVIRDPKIRACGLTLLGLYAATVVSLWVQASYMGYLLDLSTPMVALVMVLLVGTMTARFAIRIKGAF